MTAERIFPNYRKVYTYRDGNDYISYRIVGPGCTKAVQFISFDSPGEAKAYFEKELL